MPFHTACSGHIEYSLHGHAEFPLATDGAVISDDPTLDDVPMTEEGDKFSEEEENNDEEHDEDGSEEEEYRRYTYCSELCTVADIDTERRPSSHWRTWL